MRYYEIIQPQKSEPKAAPKTVAVSPKHPRAVRIASGTGPVRV